MLTRPDPAATAEENATLARIAELEAAIRGTQPCTPADIKAALRWWIGDNLPEYARALASPDAMRAWIGRQASGPASRPGTGSYDSAIGRYYRASPEGLRTSKGSDTRTPPFILWEEIPAWIQPGLSAGLRDRLAATAPRQAPGRRRAAAAGPPAGGADPAGQADDPLPRPLREAIDAAWAAIGAAPPPSPADLDHARRIYRGTDTTQQPLPGSPANAGRPGPTAPRAPRQDHIARPPGEPARPLPQDELPPPRQDAPAASRGEAAGHATTWPARGHAGTPAGAETTASATAAPDRSRRGRRWSPRAGRHGTSRPRPRKAPCLSPACRSPTTTSAPAWASSPCWCSRTCSAVMDGQPMNPAIRLVAPHSGERAPGEPGSGARETVTASPRACASRSTPRMAPAPGCCPWPRGRPVGAARPDPGPPPGHRAGDPDRAAVRHGARVLPRQRRSRPGRHRGTGTAHPGRSRRHRHP